MENQPQTQTQSHSIGNALHKVGEAVSKAVTHETVKPHRHEESTTAVDREVHQHHFHTSVQPVQEQRVLPEQHSHVTAPTKHHEFHHGNDEEHHAHLAKTAGQFKDEHHVATTHETHSTAPSVAKEHVHHHVHETVQPVIHRETIQPHVVHTTVPVHEVHHNAPVHHNTTTLPTMTMSEFQQQGGVLTGRDEHVEHFNGDRKTLPAGVRDIVGTTSSTATAGSNHHQHQHQHQHQHHDGQHKHNGAAGHVNATDDVTAKHGHATTKSHAADSTTTTAGGAAQPAKKTGLLAKLDPRVDADGDGHAGFLS